MDLFSSATVLERRIVAAASQKRIPLGGGFELSPVCNMDCRMCFLRLSPAEAARQGGLRTAREWLELADAAVKAGLLFLTLPGGEPFLYPDFAALYRGLCQLGLIITINTNGTLLNEEILAALDAHKPRRVNVTLYGSSDEVYARLCKNPQGFSQTMAALRQLKAHDIAVKLNASLTKENIADYPHLCRIADELELPIMPDSYMFPCSRKGTVPFDHASRLSPRQAAGAYIAIKRRELDSQRFAQLRLAMTEAHQQGWTFSPASPPEPIACRAGVSSFWVNWHGNMTPCVFMDAPAINVFESGFDRAWEFVREARDAMFMPAKCTSCSRRNFCTVCAAAVLTETGSLENPPDYVCSMTGEKLRMMSELTE